MNMTKKGDKHLRTLFIHGARAVVRVATNNNDGHMNQWVSQLKERRGFNKTTVAVANKKRANNLVDAEKRDRVSGSVKLIPYQKKLQRTEKW